MLVLNELKKLLRLGCDAWPYGEAAVILRVMENSEEKPFAVAVIGLG